MVPRGPAEDAGKTKPTPRTSSDKSGGPPQNALARNRRVDRGNADALRKRDETQATARVEAETQMPAGTTFRDCEDCPEMVVVPAGSFEMGSSYQDGFHRLESEKPVHQVTIAAPFAVGKYEVTRGEFSRFVSETGYSTGNSCRTREEVGEIHGWQLRHGRDWRSPGFRQTDRHPVVCVNWNDAKAYIAWLSRKTGEEYALLSESEWEYAARGGSSTWYFWGKESDEQCRYANATDESVKKVPHEDWRQSVFPSCNDGYIYTSPVGSFAPNGFGLYDMTGNVLEWAEDCWHNNYVGAPSDGSAWITEGDCDKRIARGGSWYDVGYTTFGNRPASRRRGAKEVRASQIGFRIARTLSSGAGAVDGSIGDRTRTSLRSK